MMMSKTFAIKASAVQFEREAAESRHVRYARFLWAQTCAILKLTAKGSSKLDVVNSLYRYPSPNRPAYSPSGPITVFCLNSAQTEYDIGYHSDLGFGARTGGINCDVPSDKTIGLRLCKRHQSSSRQWQFLVWLVALTMTWNAALRAQAQALSPQNCLAQTGPVQWLSAQASAFFVMMQASLLAAKLETRAHRGRTIDRNRRRGFALAAVLRFGD
jgi:hypothetical protein